MKAYAKNIYSSVVEIWSVKAIFEIFLILMFFVMVTALILYKVVLVSNIDFNVSFWSIYGALATIFLISRIPYSYLYQDNHEKTYSDSEYPDVSIIIAAKNEVGGIFKTIEKCIESRYPGQIECIVVDDGSTDGTKNEVVRAQEHFGEKIRLIVFDENRGKREAMETGINLAKNEIIVFVDSDSFIASDAIRHVTEHFLANKQVGAVSGNTKVENVNSNIITKIQSIKYAVSFDIYKASESVHGSVTCCPGCFSAYRKKTIKPLISKWKDHSFFGSKSTFGDDRGLTNFVLKDGWEIVYCEKAKATTITPEKFSVYWRQQLRWKKSWIREGIFASTFMWKNRHPLASFAFYMTFSFPFIAMLLVLRALTHAFVTSNPIIFAIFLFGFLLLGMVFALFTRVYYEAENWMYMPLVSLLFISVFIWQMPWAILTLGKTEWGTR